MTSQITWVLLSCCKIGHVSFIPLSHDGVTFGHRQTNESVQFICPVLLFIHNMSTALALQRMKMYSVRFSDNRKNERKQIHGAPLTFFQFLPGYSDRFPWRKGDFCKCDYCTLFNPRFEQIS